MKLTSSINIVFIFLNKWNNRIVIFTLNLWKEKELEKFVSNVLSKNPKAVLEYRNGDVKAFNFLIGEVMRVTNRRADSVVTRKLIEKMIGK